MDDRHAGFAGSYPSPNTNIPLQSAQQYPYSSANPASSSSSAPATHSHQQLSKTFHAAGEQQQHMSLPPIQHFESHNGMQSHQQPPQPPSHAQPASQSQAQHQHAHSSSYAPAPPYQPTHYHQYQQNGALQAPMQTNLPPNGQNGMMRFPLPPQPSSLNSRQMIDSRHKREIKRRTKTGCLTCRKRRIKCDEGHPTCRNCTKSKRDCLGYDPIFKQQPGPANIQPAPTGNGLHSNSINPLADVGANAAGSIAGASNVTSNPYSSQTYPSTGTPFIPNTGAPQGGDGQLEYGNSLDPALAAGENPHSMAQSQYSHALQPQRKVKQISIEELFLINDIPPRYDHRENPPPITPSMREDVESFFKYHYAAGLDRFFETTWYGSRGLACLMSDASLLDFVGQCTEQFKAKVETKAILSLEARLVWQLAIMPRTASSTSYESTNDPLTQDLLMRLDVVENLLTGQFMDPTKVPPGNTGGRADQAPLEIPFWHHLGRFVTLHDDLSNPSTTKDVMDCLSVLRNVLTMIESRDVLYSIAVVRHIGGRMPEFHPNRQIVAPTADRESALTMVQVAQTFLDNETTRGSTQILQRVCCMAIQGFILQKQ